MERDGLAERAGHIICYTAPPLLAFAAMGQIPFIGEDVVQGL